MKDGAMIAIAIVAAVLLLGNQGINTGDNSGGTGDNSGGNGVDLCKLVDGQVSFTGQDKYLAGTTRNTDWVRVIELNGDNLKRDLGRVYMASGTLATTPESSYKLYYGENTTEDARYIMHEDYKAP